MDEELKLKTTIELIQKEIERLKNKRINVSKRLIELTSNEMEEFRVNPEDPLNINPFNHEYLLNQDLYSIITKKIKELNILKDSPYFGRVDFNDLLLNIAESIYIGKFSFFREEDDEPLIVDWRSPVANLFYEEKIGRMTYNAPAGQIPVNVTLKRQYLIKNGVLINMFDTELNVDDEMLQLVLGKNADDRLKDIVMTIQKEQNAVIRRQLEKNLIVQGVAGSGKTSIALHRVAYLLYTYRDKLRGDDILVFGPNELFLDYISDVLPSLGEENIKQMTFERFCRWFLNTDIKVLSLKYQFERIIKNDIPEKTAMIKDTARFKGSIKFKEIIDKYIAYLQDYFFEFEDIKINDVVIIDKSELTNMFKNMFKHMPIGKRIERIRIIAIERLKSLTYDIINILKKEYKRKLLSLDKDDIYYEYNKIELKDRYQEIIKEVKRQISEHIEMINNMWRHDIISIYRKMYDRNTLSRICEDQEVVELLIKNSADLIKNSVLEYDDLAPIIYIAYKIEQFRLGDEIKHVVIDEAQDFTPFQFCVIKELIGDNRTMTILGDLSQGIYSYKSIKNWDEVKEILGPEKTEFYTLNRSYRSTIEIMEFTKHILPNNLSPMVRSGEKPCVIKSGNNSATIKSICENIRTSIEKGFKSIAVICKTSEESKYIYDQLKNEVDITLIDDEKDDYTGKTIVIPSYLSKGLEFDVVIIPDISALNYQDNDIDRTLLYTVITRTLHKVYMYYSGEITPIIKNIKNQLYDCKII
ncbi:DNA helicase-2 / ATP-dependent DNA helicase PcrA [Caldanaerobius fijiensis DSM 17918]|uniref:DNA helicase-2 / ATP-dependent DNA helicase PcrA n=1 Tax=Caldanaerobius fijiensis DSM 17918 TaxID=1121256 RepID=A0A1M5BUU0_9THEO|nr:RNA polymerase recycling motor HelD [Caldanaerobius fijiensis]SHF46299.1 DNA helicase-2 / ATP-dependent DNA helicase PcrA [Caldanaerobius fijiensis DSM 17918]